MKTKAERRAAVLKFMADNPSLPIGAGYNPGRTSSAKFHASTLRSMEAEGVIIGKLGNDGDRWYYPLSNTKVVAEVLAEAKEIKLVEDFKRVDAEYNRLSDEVHNLFYPRAVAAYELKDERGLMDIIDKCPAHVTKCFMLDLLRQLRKGE